MYLLSQLGQVHPRTALTRVVNDKSGVADWRIASESEEEAVTAALYPFG